MNQTMLPGSIDPVTITVNELVRTAPETLEVLNRFEIEACCGGDVPILEAAKRDRVDPAELLTALAEVLGTDR